ncbi:MAG TPA: peptidase M50 [Oribacterium sp.]|nr:peptidase M50 [Oribacterium sp.]
MNILSIIIAIFGLGFLVFFHEFGHFLAAKLCHVGVLEFSIGMGPRLFSRVIRNTRYSLKLLPFGGSCAMLGEDSAGSGDFLTSEGTEDAEWIDYDGVRFRRTEIPDYNFSEKSAGKRFFICIAGVLNNFILAALLSMILVAFCGYDRLYVMETSPDTPVSSAGFERGDALESIGYAGKKQQPVPGYRDLFIWLYVNSADFDEHTELQATVLRNGEKIALHFQPYFDTGAQKYKLGISFYGGRFLPENAKEFLEDSFYEVRYNTTVVLQSLKLLVHGRVERQEVMGPVGAVTVMGSTVEESSQYGAFNAFLVLLELLVMLSANLGVMNLLPVPALDGGRLLFILLEMISRRRLNPKLEERINEIGMILLLILMALVMSNDLFNLFTGAYSAMLGR